MKGYHPYVCPGKEQPNCSRKGSIKIFLYTGKGNDGVRTEASITFIKHQNITKYMRVYILTIFERKVIEPSHNRKIIP